MQQPDEAPPKPKRELQWYHLGGPTRNIEFKGRQFELKSLIFGAIGLSVISIPFHLAKDYSPFLQKYANIDSRMFLRLWTRGAALTLPYVIVSRSLGDYPNRDEARLMEFTTGMITAGIAFSTTVKLWYGSSVDRYRYVAVPHFLLTTLGLYLAQDAAFWYHDQKLAAEKENSKNEA
jgi:hypothetical protein